MAIPLILQGIPRLLPFLTGSTYMSSQNPEAIEYLMKKESFLNTSNKQVLY